VPNKPLRPCNKVGCPNLTRERYCDQHKPQEHKRYDDKRENAAKRGYDHRWRKARLAFLRKYPLCKHCLQEGKLTPATVVDHIVPHKGNTELFWDEENWQSLCDSHHSRKTAKEDGGFGLKKNYKSSSKYKNKFI
jgi:5-methylcytosine-specific restriction enzyme A